MTSEGERFAVAMQKRAGVAYWWFFGLTDDQLGAKLSELDAMPVDISACVTPQGLRFAAILVPREGQDVDWYYGQNSADITRLLKSGGRLRQMRSYDTPAGHRYVITIVKPVKTAWWWFFGISVDDILRQARTEGSFANTISTYVEGGVRKYACIMLPRPITSTNLERHGKVRAMLGESHQGGWHGFYLRQISGSVIEAFNETTIFDPASSIKSLVHAHAMRGQDTQQAGLFSYLSPEERVPATHPLRPTRQYVDTALTAVSPQLEALYARTGRPSIAPEKLLRALLLQLLYSLWSERLLMEELQYNLLFRWFVGLDLDAPVWDVTVFTKNRDRLLAGQIATAFFEQVLAQAKAQHLLSDEHFTVDGTLIEAWAGQKSFKPKAGTAPVAPPDDPGNPSVDFRGERRTNATHASSTDPEARLYKKAAGQEAKLCFLGHVLMENRHGLVVNATVTPATGTAEREAALALLASRSTTRRITLGGDKNYDTQQFVQELRAVQVTPHVTQHTTNRASAIDGRTTRHPGYAISQQKRKRVEEIFGWLKTVGLLRKVKLRGVPRVGWLFTFAAAAYNLVQMRNLVEAAT